jgi:hypothetical protein
MTKPIDTAELRRLYNALPDNGPWERGGPYPGTSVIVCVDGGSWGDCPEPPAYEPVCIIDQRQEGESNPIAVAVADFIAAAHNICPSLLAELDALRARVEKLEAERLQQRVAELEATTDTAYRVLDGIYGRNFLADELNRSFQMQGKYDGAMSEACKELFRKQHDDVLAVMQSIAIRAQQAGGE